MFVSRCRLFLAAALLAACSSGGPAEGVLNDRRLANSAAISRTRPAVPSVSAARAEPPTPADPSIAAPATALIDTRPRMQRQWDHVASATSEDCRVELAKTGARFRDMPDQKAPNARGCGIPRGVLLSRGPTGIQYSPPLGVDCSFALRLVALESIVQQEAEAELGAPIVRATTVGSFSCRKVIGRLRGWSDGISEHSFGNAVDVTSFQSKKGRVASVLRHFDPGADDPGTAEGRFLRSVKRRIRGELRMRVLGPDFDASHRDHYHLDAGSPRWQ